MSATILIVILTCIISYYAFQNHGFFNRLKHYPFQEQRDQSYTRWLSAGFLHGSWTHLLVNMFVLYQFGEEVEHYLVIRHGAALGRIYFITAYVLIIILANIPTFFKQRENPGFASIGASGAVSGILFMFILMEPWRMLGIMLVIPCPAIVAGILYLFYSSWASNHSNDNIDHDAHFYGAVWGIVFMILFNPDIIDLFLEKITNVPFL
jgi:membrane associated rhomboid family serine protease